MFEERQIVIGRVGVYCGCIHIAKPQSWVTDNALYVCEQSDDLDLDYLAYALMYAKLNQYASQSGQPLISGSRIYPVQILIPPKAFQKTFIERISCVNDVRLIQERSTAEMQELFSSLQGLAFQGDL